MKGGRMRPKNWHYEKGDWRKAPNLISYVRLLLGWVPAALILTWPTVDAAWWWAVVVFCFVAATDAVDGFVARRFGLVTELGKLMDPLVDKILVVVTLIALSWLQPWVWIVTGLVLVREVVVTWQIRSRGKLVAAIWSGKVKMACQVAMIVVLLMPIHSSWWMGIQGFMIGAAVYWTIYSWVDYYRHFVRT